MLCFNHNSEEAVGLCKYCQKGLCNDCCDIVRDIYICCKSEACNKGLDEEYQIIERSKDIYRIGKYKTDKPRFGTIFYLLVGIAFLIMPTYSLVTSRLNNGDILAIILGVLFLFFGVYSYLRGDKIY